MAGSRLHWRDFKVDCPCWAIDILAPVYCSLLSAGILWGCRADLREQLAHLPSEVQGELRINAMFSLLGDAERESMSVPQVKAFYSFLLGAFEVDPENLP